MLISHEARIRKAVDRLRKAHTFTMQEQNWIKRMEDYLLNEAVLNVQVFDEDSRFKSQGGFAKINKVFGNKLESVVIELNEYLYDDGGRTCMTTQEIVSKLWNLCNVLRDDGITYHQYVTELTYILFLKMAKETGAESQIPEGYRWDVLKAKSGVELKKFYKELLNHLGENCTGRVREIYQGSATNIDEPKNLEKIITTIDELDWFSAREEGLGNLYEGLLEKMRMKRNLVQVSILHRGFL